MNSIAIENFINRCDELMLPATEGTIGNKFASILDSIKNVLLRIAEVMKRLLYKAQSKMRKEKSIYIPRLFHERFSALRKSILSYLREVMKNDGTFDIRDNELDAIIKDYEAFKSDIEEDKQKMRERRKSGEDVGFRYSEIPIKEIYDELIYGSNVISNILKMIEQTKRKKDLDESTKQKIIHNFRNEIKVNRILSEIMLFYLSYRKISDKNMNDVGAYQGKPVNSSQAYNS